MSKYRDQLQERLESIEWAIQLPEDWSDDHECGVTHSLTEDDRLCQRLVTKTRGLLWFEKSHLPRGDKPVGIQTQDFSRSGVRFLAPFSIFKEERVRIALPSMWLRLSVVRCQPLNSKCFEVGAKVISRHEPTLEVFQTACPAADTDAATAAV